MIHRSTMLFSLLCVAWAALPTTTRSESKTNRFEATDVILKDIAAQITDFKPVVTIDHARLAEKEGVLMPPCVVSIYSDPAINTALLKINTRVGLDLPLKILVFEEQGRPAVTYPSADFLAKRYGIDDPAALSQYDAALQTGFSGLDPSILQPVKDVSKDYGIVELTSDFPFPDTIARLKAAVMKQGDTVWFGEIDFQQEAADAGVKLPKATLLLFGGPKPGGMAMAQFPKLGLDAFCQKLLVYEDEPGNVKIIFNNIADMAKLHYGTSEKSHKVINGRLIQTFKNAAENPE